ncbi:MAG: N-acetylmuramoyl-L-alanine amidase [Candidatus Scalindua rubra]|uniref:N-acetylmuramoyl-L-alanine amidase n=1 Tax=Candidatus Scalindua rubra TaxID=1872076 RepID=A0A1E3X862_9BACT|nr:MAG: N-acetylmuramoyl-L-alanine amidase [Candidatus Scalindua rubra]
MKIVERHVIIFSIAMFVTAIGLFIYLPFIGTKRQFIVAIDIEELCRVDVDENDWEYVVLHHSATDEGNASNFDRYHREKRKWLHGLAYHFVIGNGKGSGNGEIEVGERWKKQLHGAHTADMDFNRISIGICLVGNFEEDNEPTHNQIESLQSLINYLSKRYNIPKSSIIKHNQVTQKGTACPGKKFSL